MLRMHLSLALCVCAAPVFGQTEKEVSCDHQAQVVAAVRQARLDDVTQQNVSRVVMQEASWPDKFNKIVPIVTPWIYGLTVEEVQQNDLARVWSEGCLGQ